MAGNSTSLLGIGDGASAMRRRTLRSYHEHTPQSDATDGEAPRDSVDIPASTYYDSSPFASTPTFHSFNINHVPIHNANTSAVTTGNTNISTRGRRSRRSFARARRVALHRHGIVGSAVASQHPSPAAQDFLGGELNQHWAADPRETDAFVEYQEYNSDSEGQFARAMSGPEETQSSQDDIVLQFSSFQSSHQLAARSAKRPRSSLESGVDSNNPCRILRDREATAIMLYRNADPDPRANDIWPSFRNIARLPAHYYPLDNSSQALSTSGSKRRPPSNFKMRESQSKEMTTKDETSSEPHNGRPVWNLPVELVELIAGHLNRDDIKSLRMVSRELDFYISQVIFKTVVVPFNTEVYGMLGQDSKPDVKGKGRANSGIPGYSWKNANGDEVYNGHGLDVFKGFGKHILRFGMSFEVDENSLSQPPVKSFTERKASFWGNYDWPFESYRRFDTIAGLETAADETPRMKTAFSELTKVRELALSLDNGLGWLNGPDRSIRARILQRPRTVFGTLKDVPDRRAQAQQELWNYITSCHRTAGQDIKLATLYRLDGVIPVERDEACICAEEEPGMPYLDAQLIHEAIPHDVAELSLPASCDDPDVLDRFITVPKSTGTGILYSSVTPPSDAGQIMSPIIPANLTNAQKEWLLETEWAQRAFMSSYMLSVIDNPLTFARVHTLNISRLSDRYISMLNRTDFWDVLPNLTDVTLLVVPSWRTVHKDEAGFVDTININPVAGLNPFCELLKDQLASRPSIRCLTIGWAAGGEHAEGLHARNKLLMPAPLLPLGVYAEHNSNFVSPLATESDSNELSTTLLHFPHVERLVLKNCWITPAMLLQFVQSHDTASLKALILDSVSLTAMLRRNGDAHHLAQPGVLNHFVNVLAALSNNGGGQGANQTQGQVAPNNNQLLQWLVQTIQLQLVQLPVGNVGVQQQNQIAAVQAQIQLLQQQGLMQAPVPAQPQATQNAQNLPGPVNPHQAALNTLHQLQAFHNQAAQPNFQLPTTTQSLLQSQPRQGSWMNVIDIISPGTNLRDFGSHHSKANPERQTSLRSIQFISCGYAKLTHANLDQDAIETGHPPSHALRNPALSKRRTALTSAMLNSKWAHLGEIMQEVDLAELAALNAGWDLKTGWDDAEEAKAVEFDHMLPGGTGRFTGQVTISDRLTDGDEAVSAR